MEGEECGTRVGVASPQSLPVAGEEARVWVVWPRAEAQHGVRAPKVGLQVLGVLRVDGAHLASGAALAEERRGEEVGDKWNSACKF